jgi:hypothetical protein
VKTNGESTARKITWGVLAIEFACIGLAFQMLLGASLANGLAGVFAHAPAMWILAAIITLISADHVHRAVKRRLSK